MPPTPGDRFAPQDLVGKRVAFAHDEEHADCWHEKMGLQTGVVRRVAQSRAQKAELLGGEGLPLPDISEEDEAVRLWILVDPCPSFPRGCESAVAIECLLVDEP